MHRKTIVVFTFLFAFFAMMACSLRRVEGQTAAPQTAAPQAEKSTAPQAAPPVAKEAAKADDKSTPAKTRAFTEDSKPFVSDRHIALGLECSSCHGDAATKLPVTTDQCLQCHESFEELAKKTVDIKPNPHSNHLTDSSDIDCSYCHHGHKANEIGCRKCHADRVFIRNSATDATKK